MNSEAITVTSLTKAFGSQRAVDAVSFSVAAGERLFVVGPSGCGKTTLLRLIAGLERPDSGELRIFAQLVAGPSVMVPPARRQLSMVFQSFALWPHMTAIEHLRYAGGKRAPPEWIAQLVAMTRLVSVQAKYPAMLSGGEQQRLALARALVTRPRLLLMDEPLRNLDPVLASELRREMDELFRELGMTVVYVTHDQREALELGQRMLIMRAGRVEALGTPVELTRSPQTAFAARFLGQANVFEVRVKAGAADGPFGAIKTDLPQGTLALVCIQPHDVKLSRTAGTWRVVRLLVRADQVLVELEDEHQTLLVAALANGMVVAPGDRLSVRVDHATIRALRGGST
ncbi:MAG: ABC transporter ATP-binding protein [Planctomycetota bacterium]